MKNIIIDNISTSYFITEGGKCYNDRTGKYLKGQENYKNHYLSYNLTLPDGKKKRAYAHRLVALAFIPNNDPKNKTQINHIDGNKLNNCVENLEWVTPQENSLHSIKHKLRKNPHIYCFNKEKVCVAEYKTIADAVRATRLSASIIQQEVNKEIKTLSGGFYWSKTPQIGLTKNYHSLGKAKEVYQYDKNGKFINRYSSIGEAARSIGVCSGSHIGECCRGKIKTYKGFIWRYSEDIVLSTDENSRTSIANT